jgi:hypothetical protein
MIYRVGRVVWMPSLQTEFTEALSDAVRQAAPFGGHKMHPNEPIRRRRNDDDSPKRRFIPKRIETALIPAG